MYSKITDFFKQFYTGKTYIMINQNINNDFL